MRVLFLDLDTLRPDHLGCYGYSRNTSPNLDKIASQGVRFEKYYCSDAPCLPSRTSLMSGRFGIHTGVVGHGGTAADMRLEGEFRGFVSEYTTNCLPGVFRKAGFRTVSVSPFAERHSSFTFLAGFNEVYNTGKSGMESAEEVTPTVLNWIKQNAKEDNWFLHINYWDAHTPYRAPAEFGNPFENEPLPEWLTEEVLAEHVKLAGPHTANEFNMYDNRTSEYYPRNPGDLLDMDGVRKVIDGYDCGIKYMDNHIGMVMNALEEAGVSEDLAIIISADHAENLGELGIYGEHATADHANCRIPMIIKWPGASKGACDTGFHYNLDLCPTIADLLNVPHYEKWDGTSYAQSLLKQEDTGRNYLVIGQCCHGCQRGVLFDNYLYIRTYHDGYHLFPKEMLFDLSTDEHEQYNLAGDKPELCYKGAHLLLQWHDEMMATSESEIDPMWTVMKENGPFHTWNKLKPYLKRLEETGRADKAQLLRQKFPKNAD